MAPKGRKRALSTVASTEPEAPFGTKALEIDSYNEELPQVITEDSDSEDEYEKQLEEELRREYGSEGDDEPELSEGSDELSEGSEESTEDEPEGNEDGITIDFMKKGKQIISDITGKPKMFWKDGIDGDYLSDDSDQEVENRIGNIPAYFYDDLPHIGYNIDGKQIMRPAVGDELDKFLEGVEGDGGWSSVKDKLHQTDVQLTEEELALIQRLAKSENPSGNDDDFYAPINEHFSRDTMVMPLTSRPEPKSRFLPSKWEHKKVMKIVRAIREGRIVPRKPQTEKKPFELYSLWNENDAPRAPHAMYMPMPKINLPGHSESYNPPEEYIYTPEEEAKIRQAEEEEEVAEKDRKFLPKKFSSLRVVPAYDSFVSERFERCLDLYLAPRGRRKRREGIEKPEDLLPVLPKISDLRPFPTTESIVYHGPKPSRKDKEAGVTAVRSRALAIDPTGMWVAFGYDDGKVRLFELLTGRCAVVWDCNPSKKTGDGIEPVVSLEWCPDREKMILAVACGSHVYLFSPLNYLSPYLASQTTQAVFSAFNTASKEDEEAEIASSKTVDDVKWLKPRIEDDDSDSEDEDAEEPEPGSAEIKATKDGRMLTLSVVGQLKQIVWHKRGDYFATLAENAGSRSVLVHQLSKHHTQAPFKNNKGDVQRILFHPLKPLFFVATQRYVRMYDLMAQSLIKTLNPGVKWISSLDVHPLGDNVIVGSYDKRLVWHDLDLANTPYKTLKYHDRAVRATSFSPTYPLFLTSSDDGSIQVFHASVYADLLRNAMIVPVKSLKGHSVIGGLGVLDARWHPKEPWIISVGADGLGKLWCP